MSVQRRLWPQTTSLIDKETLNHPSVIPAKAGIQTEM